MRRCQTGLEDRGDGARSPDAPIRSHEGRSVLESSSVAPVRTCLSGPTPLNLVVTLVGDLICDAVWPSTWTTPLR